MGWLYMKSLKGHSGPRQYLDAQFTHDRPDVISKVLRSALAGMRVYYAAVEQARIATGQRDVWAVICLVRYNPRDPEGYIFGYKDMEESMGPYECDCPEPIRSADRLQARLDQARQGWAFFPPTPADPRRARPLSSSRRRSPSAWRRQRRELLDQAMSCRRPNMTATPIEPH